MSPASYQLLYHAINGPRRSCQRRGPNLNSSRNHAARHRAPSRLNHRPGRLRRQRNPEPAKGHRPPVRTGVRFGQARPKGGTGHRAGESYAGGTHWITPRSCSTHLIGRPPVTAVNRHTTIPMTLATRLAAEFSGPSSESCPGPDSPIPTERSGRDSRPM